MHFAYIDPGSGSLFIQALIGSLVAGAFVFRNFIRVTIAKVSTAFKRGDKVTESAED